MSGPAWDRIAVVGCSGSGKTTVARRLAERLGLKHTPLDDLAFGPDWQLRPEHDLRRDVVPVVAEDRWVIDGNYRHLRDLIWSRATVLVWLDLPMVTCLRRVAGRTLYRCVTGERVCGGNRETLYKALATRDSILRWVVTSHADVRRTTTADVANPNYRGLDVRRLSSRSDVGRLLGE